MAIPARLGVRTNAALYSPFVAASRFRRIDDRRSNKSVGDSRRRGPRRRGDLLSVSVVVAVVGLSGCGAEVDTDEAIQPLSGRASAGASGSPAGQSVGVDDFYKVTMTIKNTSNLTWDVISTELGHEGTGSGWEDRPTSLDPNTSETVSAYSAANGQAISLSLQAREASQLGIKLVAQDPWAGSNNTDGTKSQSPITVNASIGSGRQCTASFTISGRY